MCNGVWGNTFENRMKSVVKDMVVSGTPKDLNETEAATIVDYALLKSFVFDYTFVVLPAQTRLPDSV
jgi:hypothetical protein